MWSDSVTVVRVFPCENTQNKRTPWKDFFVFVLIVPSVYDDLPKCRPCSMLRLTRETTSNFTIDSPTRFLCL
jgi:hypothetical protein